jgi:hypothetical protein
MASNKEFWHKLLIQAGLTDDSGQDFNATGDHFASSLAGADRPVDIAGVLAFYIGTPSDLEMLAVLTEPVTRPAGGFEFSIRGAVNRAELYRMINALTVRKPEAL